MTRADLEADASQLLLEQRRLGRLGLRLGPRELQRLKSLLLRLGWTRAVPMKRKYAKPQQYHPLVAHAAAAMDNPLSNAAVQSFADHLAETHPENPVGEALVNYTNGGSWHDLATHVHPKKINGYMVRGPAPADAELSPEEREDVPDYEFRQHREWVGREWDDEKKTYVDTETPTLPTFGKRHRDPFWHLRTTAGTGRSRLVTRSRKNSKLTSLQVADALYKSSGPAALVQLIAGMRHFHPETIAAREQSAGDTGSDLAGRASVPKFQRKPIRYARYVLSAPRPYVGTFGAQGVEHDYHDETGKKLGVLRLHPKDDGRSLHVSWIGPEDARAGDENASNRLGADVRSLVPELQKHYPNAEFVTGIRAGGFRGKSGNPERVVFPLRKRLARKVVRYGKVDHDVPAHHLIQGFPIEHALRHLANDPKNTGDVRDLAMVALTGKGKLDKAAKPEGKPEALWALHDALHESDHPMKNHYNWMSAADKVQKDANVYKGLRGVADEQRAIHHYPEKHWAGTPEEVARRVHGRGDDVGGGTGEQRWDDLRRHMATIDPAMGEDEIKESVGRHAYRARLTYRDREKIGNEEHHARALLPHAEAAAGDKTWAKEHKASRYRRKRYATPRSTNEGGTLTPEQMHIADEAIRAADMTGLGVLGDHLAENGFPGAGFVLSRVATGQGEWRDATLPEGTTRETQNTRRPVGEFHYAVLRDGSGVVHVLRLRASDGRHYSFFHRVEGPPKARKYAQQRNDFIDALRQIKSSNQQTRHKIARELAVKLKLHPVKILNTLHHSPRGSTPGILQAVYGPASPEAIHQAANWLGLTSNSPGVAVFHFRPNGPDLIHRVRHEGSGMELVVKLGKYGVKEFNLVTHKKGFDVLVPDKGGALRDRVQQYADAVKAVREESPGHFSAVGSADQAAARSGYRDRIAAGERKQMARRRKKEGYDGFVRALFDDPTDLNAAKALQDWFDDRGMSHAADVIRKSVERFPAENGPWRVGYNNPTSRREQAGSWNSRFYVYAPQATRYMGGDPFTYTHLTFRHPDDKKRAISFGFSGSEQEGAEKLIGLEQEGHEPYHPHGHQHEAFRAARPELFGTPPPQEGGGEAPVQNRRKFTRYLPTQSELNRHISASRNWANWNEAARRLRETMDKYEAKGDILSASKAQVGWQKAQKEAQKHAALATHQSQLHGLQPHTAYDHDEEAVAGIVRHLSEPGPLPKVTDPKESMPQGYDGPFRRSRRAVRNTIDFVEALRGRD